MFRNSVQCRYATLWTLSLVCFATARAFAQQDAVEATQVDLPVPVEARGLSVAVPGTPSVDGLTVPTNGDAARRALPTNNAGSLWLNPPKAQSNAPALGAAFEGIPDTGLAPASPNIAVGPNKIVQVVNGALRVTDRFAVNPDTDLSLNALFGNPPGGTGLFDPVCVFDHFANRFAVLCNARNSAGTDGWYMLAVTKSSIPYADPATWIVYFIRNDIDLPNTNTLAWGDYTKLGFDNTYFYITSNQMSSANVFQYAKIRLYKKLEVYGRKPLVALEFNDVRDAANNRVSSIQPAITFGTPGQEFLVSCSPTAGNAITVFNIGGPPVTLKLNRRSIAVNSWTAPELAVQKVPAPRLDAGDARLLNAVFRNNRLYTAHTVRRGTFACAAHYVGIDTTNYTKTLDVTIGSPSVSYYYPAIAVTAGGNLGTVFNFSSTTRFPGIMYTQIAPTGSLISTPAVLREGEGSYTLNTSGKIRWGEYNGIAVDPSSPDRLWFNAMYATSSPVVWGTYVGNTGLLGGRQSSTFQETATALRDQLLDWAKTTPVFGPTLP